MNICIDPGHGNWNRRRGAYDPGAVSAGHTEAEIVMDWANELREVLRSRGHKVVRTRVDEVDPAPVSRRDDIARAYGCTRMVSLHCNAFNGSATGAEVIYRGSDDRDKAAKLSKVVSETLNIPNRGSKTEKDSQHPSLAVMEFDKCWLIELGFIDNPVDRARLLDSGLRKICCEKIADVLVSQP